MQEVSGGYGGGSSLRSGGSFLKSVLEYNPKTQQWEQAGEMKESRADHGISTVTAQKILDNCF